MRVGDTVKLNAVGLAVFQSPYSPHQHTCAQWRGRVTRLEKLCYDSWRRQFGMVVYISGFPGAVACRWHYQVEVVREQ